LSALQWQSAAHTHRGNYRTRNEDSVFCASDRMLWAVADGMGGHNAGDFASEAIAQSLADVELSVDLANCVDRLEDCLLDVNDHLRQHAKAHCGGKTVGSTVVALVIRDRTAVTLWAGDSRLYRLRDGNLQQVTRDHNPVADLLDVGGVTEDQALNADTHIITRAVGGQRDLHLDVAVFDVEEGDSLLLCSDGLYRELSSDQLKRALRCEAETAVDELLDECLKGPARDNVSVVVAKAEALK